MSRSKYNARAVEADGHRFDSQMEYRRYGELRLLEQAGAITALRVHEKWPLVVNGVRCVKLGHYESDFTFVENGQLVVEDVKGYLTPMYRLKKKLMLALYDIEIVEVTA